MKITVDTSVLVRAVVSDDKKQAEAAHKALNEAKPIAIPLPCLCELVWVLRRVYNFGQNDVASAIETLVNVAKVAVNRPAVDAGLAILKAGGDFADGLIAYEGNWLRAETLISFDGKAVSLLMGQGLSATLLA